MKRHCNIIFLVFFLFSAGNNAKAISFVDPYHVSFSCADRATGNAFKCSNSEGKGIPNDYVVILFKKGIEGKGHTITFKHFASSLIIGFVTRDTELTDSSWLHYQLCFSELILLRKEYIPVFPFRGPPVVY